MASPATRSAQKRRGNKVRQPIRLAHPQTEWDVLHGLMMAYRHGDIPVVPCHVKEYSVTELRIILERHFSSVKILSSKSGGRLTESETGQKMVALCR